jgi:hypothetical protein
LGFRGFSILPKHVMLAVVEFLRGVYITGGTSGRPAWQHAPLAPVFSSTPHSFSYIAKETMSSPRQLSTPRRKTVSGELPLFAPTLCVQRNPETSTRKLTRYVMLWHTRRPLGYVSDARGNPIKSTDPIGLPRFRTSWTFSVTIIRSSPRLLCWPMKSLGSSPVTGFLFIPDLTDVHSPTVTDHLY